MLDKDLRLKIESAVANILKEGITDITFHKTSLWQAADIIKNNKFMTSVAFGTETDMKPNKDRLYFLSTMRSPAADYYRAPPAVIFKLDGRKLSYNHKGSGMDYWGAGWGKDEMEDRLYTDKPYIDNAMSYIKEIHIVMEIPEGGESDMILDRLKEAELIHKIAESNKIPVFFYGNEKDFEILNRTKRMTFEQWKEAFKGAEQSFREPMSGYSYKKRPDGWLVDIIEIIKGIETGDTSSIDKSYRSMWYRLKYYSRELDRQIANSIHNNKSDPSERDNIAFVGRHAKKHGGLKGLVRYLSKAATEIDEKERSEDVT